MRIKIPQEGDFRIVKRFLWLPERHGAFKIWLETVYKRQNYVYGNYWDATVGMWQSKGLVSKGDYLTFKMNERGIHG